MYKYKHKQIKTGLIASLTLLSLVCQNTPAAIANERQYEQIITLEQYQQHQTLILIPEGNRNPSRPKLPDSTLARLTKEAAKATKNPEQPVSIEQMIEIKYRNTMSALKNNGIPQKLMQIAPLFDIEPEQIYAALLGEHTYNVGIEDKYQNRFIRVFNNIWYNRESYRHPLLAILATNVFRNSCDQYITNNYNYWTCVRETWNNKVRGRIIDNTSYSSEEYISEFFNPVGAGKSYGLGQLGPHQILSLTQIVHEKAPTQPLQTLDNLNEVYKCIMNEDSVLYYIAASIYISIQQYKTIANFDISKNPGVLATLYNLGKEKQHANNIYQRNLKNLRQGKTLEYPEENYYGWLINEKYPDIVQLFDKLKVTN